MSSIAVLGSATGAGVITLAAPITATNRTITLPDATGTLLSTATPGVPIGGPAFSAYPTSSSQTPTINTFTKVTLGSEQFDTNNNFASSTFTPAVAGYYQVNCTVQMTSVVGRLIVSIYKGGAEYARGIDIQSSVTTVSITSLVYMNGTTDYVELYTYNSSGGTTINTAFTSFSGVMVRSAT
jgi:hypothetical protein